MKEPHAAFSGMPTIRATINYIGDMPEEPYMYYRDPPLGHPFTNIVDDPREAEIYDVRANSTLLNLRDDGIAFLEHGHHFLEFDDDEGIRTVYYAEVEQMFRELLGVDRVFAYDFSVRRPAHGPARPEGIPVAGTRRRPIKRAHGDFVTRSFDDMVRWFGERCGPNPMADRRRAFNFWRPIRGPLTDRPLALCHPCTVSASDLVEMKQFNDPRDNYIAALRYNPRHRWCYLSGMEAGEGVVFSSYDSAHPQARGVVMHTAIDDPHHSDAGLPRASIEVRVMAFGECRPGEMVLADQRGVGVAAGAGGVTSSCGTTFS